MFNKCSITHSLQLHYTTSTPVIMSNIKMLFIIFSSYIMQILITVEQNHTKTRKRQYAKRIIFTEIYQSVAGSWSSSDQLSSFQAGAHCAPQSETISPTAGETMPANDLAQFCASQQCVLAHPEKPTIIRTNTYIHTYIYIYTYICIYIHTHTNTYMYPYRNKNL